MRLFALFLAICSVLMAQDLRQIVQTAARNEERSWRAFDHYTYTERDELEHLDSHARVKSPEVDILKAVPVNGSTIEQTVSHNSGPPTASQRHKDQEAMQKARNENPAARAATLRAEKENRAFIDEVPQAFDFQLIGEDTINGRPAYVLEATPKHGYHSQSKYGRMFPKVHGKLWIDKQDLAWVKVAAEVTAPFSMGFFLARVQRGSHILFQQTRVADGVWMAKKVEVHAFARVFFLVRYNTDQSISYSDYRPVRGPQTAQSAH